MKLVALGTLLILFCVLTFGFTRINPNQIAPAKTFIETPEPIIIPLEHKPLEEIADTLSLEAGIHPRLTRAIIKIESNWNKNARSKAGAIGLMQIMPANFRECRLKCHHELENPVNNIRCGLQLLKERLKRFRNRVIALRSYNASKKCWKGECPKVERYVQQVLADFSHELPVLVDDNI